MGGVAVQSLSAVADATPGESRTMLIVLCLFLLVVPLLGGLVILGTGA